MGLPRYLNSVNHDRYTAPRLHGCLICILVDFVYYVGENCMAMQLCHINMALGTWKWYDRTGRQGDYDDGNVYHYCRFLSAFGGEQ